MREQKMPVFKYENTYCVQGQDCFGSHDLFAFTSISPLPSAQLCTERWLLTVSWLLASYLWFGDRSEGEPVHFSPSFPSCVASSLPPAPVTGPLLP